jgi:hypothetical protein
MVSYLISGLSVESDLTLPGLIALPESLDRPDVRLHAGTVPAEMADAASVGPNWQIASDRFTMTVPGIVRMLITGGNEMTYELLGATTPQDAAIFLSGTGFGILLHQRGRIVLHASAVRVNDQAVLFCGQSGAGKSTLAAALSEAGYDLVTDDFCGITMRGDGTPWVEPDGRQLKLWQNSIDRLALADRTTAPVRTHLEKFYVEPRTAISAPLPLAAVYILREARPPDPPGIERPNIVDGALLIRRNAYRPQMVQRMEQQALYFQAAATIGQRSGVFTLTRAMDFKQFPTVIGWLEDHWRTLGLLEPSA